MNNRFALANVKSRIKEGPEDANVQAAADRSSGKQTWKPLSRDGKRNEELPE